MKYPSPENGQSGFALFAVMAFLLLAGSIATPFLISARSYAFIAKNTSHEVKIRIAAASIIDVAAQRYFEHAAENSTLPTRIVCDVPDRNTAITLQFLNHSGLIDLNSAPEGLLQIGFEALGADTIGAYELAVLVTHYRAIGATTSSETANPVIGGLKHAPFETVSELLDFPLPPATDQQLLSSIFTVYSRSGTIDTDDATSLLATAMSVGSLETAQYAVPDSALVPAVTVRIRYASSNEFAVSGFTTYQPVTDGQDVTRLSPIEWVAVSESQDASDDAESCARFFDDGSLAAIDGLLM